MVSQCILAFLSGAFYEGGCVLWVHYSERSSAYKAALVSMFCAVCTVVGIGESIRDIHIAPYFVIGYGTGTFIVVRLKQVWSRS